MWPEHELYDLACLQHEEHLRRAGDRRLAVAVRRVRRTEPAAEGPAAGAARPRPWKAATTWLRRSTANASSLRGSDPRKA